MPLSAILEGELVCAPLLDDMRWRGIRGAAVTLTCGHAGFPRTSPLGTHHFVHARGSDCDSGESPEHLHLKAVVAMAVAAAGWTAVTEAPGEGFIADVLAVQNDSQVALEIQRSRQTLREYERRQSRYETAGIRAVWLAKDLPTGHRAGPDLPLFLVSRWEGLPHSVVCGRTIPVPDLIRALLTGKCRWRVSSQAHQEARETMRLLCPVCGHRREVETARWLTGRCSCGLPLVALGQSPLLPERSACCGYWGPGLALGRKVQERVSQARIDSGHWCLSS